MFNRINGGRRWLAVVAAVGVTIVAASGSAFAGSPGPGGASGPAPDGGAARPVSSPRGLPAGTQRPMPNPFAEDVAAAAAGRAKEQQAEIARLQARAGTAPVPAQKTSSYQVSPAVRGFLSAGLGLPVVSALLTGLESDRSAGTLRTTFATAPTIALTLPVGVAAPSFGRASVVIDPAADVLTVTASADRASLAVQVTHASSATLDAGRDLSGHVTAVVPVWGTAVALSGRLTYAKGTVEVSLTGHPSAVIVLQSGVAELGKDSTITLTTKDGLQVVGTADLGPAAHRLRVGVTGHLGRTDTWSLVVGSAPAPVGVLLPGLNLAPAMTGTVTGGLGGVRYDVHASAAGTWRPLAGVSLSGASVRLRNTPPQDGALAAPGIGPGTPWVEVTGDVGVGAGAAGTVVARGTLAANLATETAALSARQGGTLALHSTPAGLVLGSAQFGGLLAVHATGISGSVGGTGLLTVTPASGRSQLARASLTVSPAGGLVASFPVSGTVVGLGAPGTLVRGYWSGTPVAGYPIRPGVTMNLPAGISATAVHGDALLRPPAKATAPPGKGDRATVATAGSTTYTLSPAAYGFLAGKLGIPIGSSPTVSGTLSGQTLTLVVGAPGPLPLSLPAGVPNPVFGSTTITVDEATDTITVAASATAGVTATLRVSITNAGTTALTDGADLTATLTLGAVPFVGASTITLTGNITYLGGNVSISLAGSLDAAVSLANGSVILQPGDSLSIATGTGLTVAGTALIGSAQAPYTLTVNGTFTDLKNWSLAATNTAGEAWHPLPSLTVYPSFNASITDTAGTVQFDLASSGLGSWSPGDGANLAFTGFEVSNQAPPNTVSCPSIAAGDVWIDLRGTFSYTPAGTLALAADGCADLTSRAFQIKTTASGTLLPNFSTYFQLTKATITATNSSGTFGVTASASASVTVPGGGSVTDLSAAVSIRSNGVLVAGVSIANLNALSNSLSGTGVIYLSNTQIAGFKPTDYGLGNGPFPATIPLQAGANVAYSYSVGNLPANVTTVLGNLHVTIPSGTTILAVAQVSQNGLAASLDVNFGTDAGGAQLFNRNGSAFFLDDVTLGLTVGANSSVSLAGAGYLQMPPMWSGGTASHTQLTASASLDLNTLSPVFSLSLRDWVNAFGVPGLDVKDFAASFAFSDNPSVKLSADQVTLPTGWPQAIGVAAGAQISLDITISLTQPLITFSVSPAMSGGVALTPLAVGYASQIAAGTPLTPNQQNLVNSLQISSASFYLAPFGGTTAAGLSIAPGLAISFNATVDRVAVNVEGAVGVTPPSLTVNVSVASYPIGPVTLSAAHFTMNLNPTQIQFGFSGGFTYAGNSFTGAVNLALGSTADNASISVNVNSGLPAYLAVSAALQGRVSGDGSGAQLAATGSGGFTVNGQTFGTVQFTLMLPGSLRWADGTDTIVGLITAFKNRGASDQLILTALQSVGYNSYDVLNTLGNLGSYGQTLLGQLEAVFNPFSTTYFDIWTGTSAGQLLVLDVSNGSQSPDAQVVTWTWNNGYNQDWAFLPDPYLPGWYEVVNRGSGQCLSDYGNSTSAGSPLVQYPCFGGTDQLWYFGSIALNNTYVVTNLRSWLVMDVQQAYPWRGGTMDQWSYNGGSNQQFWLTNAAN